MPSRENQSAQEGLSAFERYRPFFTRTFRIPVWLRSQICIEDILQEIARTILRTTLTRNYTAHEWDNVIHQIAIRQFRKQIRNVSLAGRHTHLSPDTHSPHEPQTSPLSQIDTLDSINKCTERQKRILMYRLEGYTFDEISQAEGLHLVVIRREMDRIRTIVGCDIDSASKGRDRE